MPRRIGLIAVLVVLQGVVWAFLLGSDLLADARTVDLLVLFVAGVLFGVMLATLASPRREAVETD